MPGNHGNNLSSEEIYRNAREEGVRIQNLRQEQREQYKDANIQQDKQLMSEVGRSRRARDERWASINKDNPMKNCLSKEMRRAEAHSSQTEAIFVKDQKDNHYTSQDLFVGFRATATGSERCVEEDELAQLRLERRRLLERQKQLKAALELRRRVFTGNISRNCKQGLQVAIENGYGRAPGSGPPPEKPPPKRGPHTQSLPALGRGVSAELHSAAFPPTEKRGASPPRSPAKSAELSQ
jgi:hypothetical protein